MSIETCLSCGESALDVPEKGSVSCNAKEPVEVIESWFSKAPTCDYYKRKADEPL